MNRLITGVKTRRHCLVERLQNDDHDIKPSTHSVFRQFMGHCLAKLFAQRMDRPSIYRGSYHSQRLHLRSVEFDASETSAGIVLERKLTVLRLDTFSGQVLQPSWSLSSLFGRLYFQLKCLLLL